VRCGSEPGPSEIIAAGVKSKGREVKFQYGHSEKAAVFLLHDYQRRRANVNIRRMRTLQFSLASSLTFFLWAGIAAPQSIPKNISSKTTIGTTYCIDQDFLPTLNAKVDDIRKLVRGERDKGKLIGYISVPLSPTGGGAADINSSVSSDVKGRLEAMYGHQIWMLTPGSQEASIPLVGGKSATGREYMYMWTQVLAGDDGVGADFDLFYFVGRTDFWHYLQITEADAIAKLKDLADARKLVGDNKRNFVSYYAFRASAAVSRGAHDEWNILQLINQTRRASPKYGVGLQIASMFDGRFVELNDIETPISAGYEGKCNP
jgi:hypothetical protein